MASRAGLAAFLMLLSVLYSFGGRTSSVLSLAHWHFTTLCDFRCSIL